MMGDNMPQKLASRVGSVADLGVIIQAKRKQVGLSQAEFAGLSGVGNRFVSDLENGKPTVQLDKTLQVLHGLGLELIVQPRNWLNTPIDDHE